MRSALLATAVAVSCLAVGTSLAQDGAPAEAAKPVAESAAPAADTPAVARAADAQDAAAPAAPSAEDQQAAAAAQEFYDSLDRQTGGLILADGKVALTVPETHYFIGAADARRVIVDVWGNPPMAAEGVEGMIFQAGGNPAAGAWGAIVQYSHDGHVKDDDAATIKYDELLADLQRATREENTQRREQGFDELTLRGWAEQPHYDQATHTLYWAKLIDSSAGFSSLNYDIRVLGREGVFVVSFVADPAELATIRASAPAVMAMPVFTTGNTYADFREGVDKTAAYGIGGLIAGGAALAAAKKFGLLALVLAFGKKFLGIIIAGAVALAAAARRMFGGRKEAAAEASGDPPS